MEWLRAWGGHRDACWRVEGNRPPSQPVSWREERCVYLGGFTVAQDTDIVKQNFVLLRREAGTSVFRGPRLNLEMYKLSKLTGIVQVFISFSPVVG